MENKYTSNTNTASECKPYPQLQLSIIFYVVDLKI